MDLTLPYYTNEFFESLIQAGRSKLTIKQYTSDLKKFFHWLESYKQNTDIDTLHALRKEDMKAYFLYLHNQKMSEATIRRLASVLRRFFVYFQCVGAHDIHKIADAAPLRPLTKLDFISDHEYKQLLRSILTKEEEYGKKSARNFLLTRNWTIVSLIRSFGLTPTDIYHLTMSHLNLAQHSLTVYRNEQKMEYTLDEQMMKNLRSYYYSIPELFRPSYYSKHPLFVAFNNISYSFQYDYERQKPKPLSVRAIQEMIKDEVKKANLRKISAITLRNTAIKEKLEKGKKDNEIMARFALTSEAALLRYKQFLLDTQIENK